MYNFSSRSSSLTTNLDYLYIVEYLYEKNYINHSKTIEHQLKKIIKCPELFNKIIEDLGIEQMDLLFCLNSISEKIFTKHVILFIQENYVKDIDISRKE